ncbi:glycosyltransferase [Exiguobacterium sp. RIT341]|uniref:glycosyltransferase n=1 Tax=Exiguobacterium sp. RIT341 TaxID=1470592 RepID=UPI00044FC8EF|nr:glycosyltransferase [Exiguobacterium sp. RIT341]EZP59691.1 Glycosyl transferase group 1 [Exiguobacterium sp. RIT341]
MHKKNIAILIPCLSKGGAERAAGLLSTYLNDDNNVYIILLDSSEIVYDHSGEVIYLNQENKFKNKFLRKINYFKNQLKKVRKLDELKEKLKIDITISFLETPNIINLLTKTKDKKIVSVRSTRSLQNEKVISRIENYLIKKMYNKAHQVIAISDGVKDDLVKKFGIKSNKIQTIYNFYDFQKINVLKEEELNDEMKLFFKDSDVILNVGRLIPAKNQSHIIDSFKKVSENNDKVKLLILGDGILKQKLKNLIKDLNLEGKVKILPFDNNPFKYMKNSKLFVLNSEREGFANVIIESMACETPVVSIDCLSGPREIIAGESDYSKELPSVLIAERGILFSKSNKDNMVIAIEAILNDHNLTDSLINRSKKYIKEYDSKNIYNKWKKVFSE